MEKYSSSCRLILCCNSSSKVTEAVRSRCLNLRVGAPSEEQVRSIKTTIQFTARFLMIRGYQIVSVLEFIAKKESLQLPRALACRIASLSNRNLRRAILSLEMCRVQKYPFSEDQVVPAMDWEQYVSEIASDIMKEQSPKRFFLRFIILRTCWCLHGRCEFPIGNALTSY